MNPVDTAYKLGAMAAVDNFTAWLQNDDGNPTDYPKRRGAILKTAQGVMQPNPNTTAPAPQPMPTTGIGGATGGPTMGSGAAPVTPPPAANRGGKTAAIVHKIAAGLMGGAGSNCREMPSLCNPGGAPKPVTPKPGYPAPQPIKTGADHIVEQVMRKLGKSMSRRPLSRDGTKYEALKKKLRKQKPKKD